MQFPYEIADRLGGFTWHRDSLGGSGDEVFRLTDGDRAVLTSSPGIAPACCANWQRR
jgi:hypothetical protein